jgi:1,4-alpha-glucan branching enzyme
MKRGAFTFVLHSHLPYCRRAGRWPHGEEWIHEALAETYLPLLVALYDLWDEHVPFRLTVGITPILAEQLTDRLVLDHFVAYAQERIERAAADVTRFELGGEERRAGLAAFYRDWYQANLDALLQRFGGDVVGAFRRLQDEGLVEIATCAATHGYLPLLARDSSVHAQITVGVQSYLRHFGRRPRAIWLPECAYRPAYWLRPGYRKPGLEEFLAEEGLSLFFAETHAVEGGTPVGKATDGVVGPYGGIPKRYLVPLPDYAEPTNRTTDLPYWVSGTEVAVIGRNNRTGMQVWSADWGYPGDGAYREFHKKDGVSGLQYWRVTGPRLDLAQKALYDPRVARERALEHARHFAGVVTEVVSESRVGADRFPIIASNYDTELFGHWWFEGITWIAEVLRLLASSEVVQLTTASDYLAANPPREVLALPEGSWGAGGTHFTWDNADNHWFWPLIHAAEERMERLVAAHPRARGDREAILAQAGRELLLLQSSDWPFLVSTGQAGEYAVERFLSHLERFGQLADLAGLPDLPSDARRLADETYELDKVFPDLDYRVFAEREPHRD